jgi:hypothetical protein
MVLVLYCDRSLRKQLRDLYTQYQHLCTAYNQARGDVDTQVRRSKSIGSALNMERNAQVEMETRCQILQNTVNTIKSIKYEADKQQMATIAKSHRYSSCFASPR